jgi:hypothetical protein
MRIKPSLDWLFICVPVALALDHAGVPAPYVFFSAALAIVPIASLCQPGGGDPTIDDLGFIVNYDFARAWGRTGSFRK